MTIKERRRSLDKLADIICACDNEKLKKALADSEAEIFRMKTALRIIARWHGQFPMVTDKEGLLSTYAREYGSNGERDYMRELAKTAIKGDL